MKDILELAREHKAEAGVWIDAQDKTWVQFYELADLEAFAQRIREDEREKAAKVCEAIERKKWETIRDGGRLSGIGPMDCAAAIRRGGVSWSEARETPAAAQGAPNA